MQITRQQRYPSRSKLLIEFVELRADGLGSIVVEFIFPYTADVRIKWSSDPGQPGSRGPPKMTDDDTHETRAKIFTVLHMSVLIRWNLISLAEKLLTDHPGKLKFTSDSEPTPQTSSAQ